MSKPIIRFNGYTEDWEQRKFSEFVKNVAKKNKDNLDLEPYAVTNDRGFIAQKDAHDDFGYMKDTDRRAYNIVPPNSFAYNPARINVGSLGYYTGSENVIVSSLYEVFQTEDYIDDRFLWHWLKSDHFPKWIEKLQEGSVRLYFYFDKLVQCQMMVPTIKEQKQISAYFDSLDELITLHQCKPINRWHCEKNVWEQRKLGEIGFAKSGVGFPDSEQGGTEGIPFYKVSDMNIQGNENELVSANNYVSKEQISRKKWKVIDDVPAIFFTKVGAAVMLNRKRLVRFPFLLDNNTMAYIFDKNVWDCDFGKTLFETVDLTQLAQTGALPSYNASDVEGIEITLPKKDEQKKIGEYFASLDNLITLHQRKPYK